MSEHINPADCKPDEVYMGMVDGDRLALIRAQPDRICQWVSYEVDGGFSFRPDFEVSGLVRLVESRPMTREDLPRFATAGVAHDRIVERTLDAVMVHLNANGGVPDEMAKHERAEIFRITGRQYQEIREELDEALDESSTLRDDRDHWRQQAHSDARERDEVNRKLLNRAVEAERERDEAIVERDEWITVSSEATGLLSDAHDAATKWRQQAHSNAVERDKAVTERDDAIAWGKDWRRRAVEAEEHAEKSERAWREVCEACDDAVVERDEWRQQAGRNGTERDELSVRVGRMVDEITSHSEGARAAQNEASRLRRERDKWRQQAEKAGFERDGWKAAAEHRGQLLDTPAVLPVTYVEVEYAINGAGTPGDPRWLSRATDAVWALLARAGITPPEDDQ